MEQGRLVAIVTGGSRGIGFAIAREFAINGINLLITARNVERLENACRELSKYGVDVIYVACDIRDRECCKKIVKSCLDHYGRIDILVNNAGTAVRKYFHDMNFEEIDEIIDTNVKGLMYLTLEVVKIMIKQRRGIIINISSGAGKSGIPQLSVYSASKAAVNIFTEALARELSRYGIRVYAVCPGGTDTELHRKLFPEHRSEWLLKPEEVARLVFRLVKEGGIEGYCYEIYRLV